MISRCQGTPRKTLLCIVSISLLLGCSTAPIKPETIAPGDYAYTRQYISWLIKKEMKKYNVTGLSIALVDDQKVVWAEGFGYADKANNVSATPDTVYRVGSISKLFTATATMQLAEQGKIDIDKPLQTCLPEFSMKSRFPDAGPITPRSIMTHHSGLPSDLQKGMMAKNPEPFTAVVGRCTDEYASFPPNYIFSYSNLGVTFLGHALEKVSTRDFVSLTADSLLRPMNMTRSSFVPGPDMLPFMAKGYRNGKETEEALIRDLPAGALHSNVLDLSRFMQMVFARGMSGEGRILKPETLAEMLRPQNVDVPLDLNFRVGLGWMLSGMGSIDIRNAGPVAHHAGGTVHFHSQLITLPEHKLGVVVLSNSSTSGAVVNKAATEALKLALEAKTGIRQPERKKPAEAESPLPPEALRAYEGWYATVAGPVKITKQSDHLRTEFMNSTMRLVPLADGELGLRYRLLGLIPLSLGELDYVSISRATVAGHDILKARSGTQEMFIGERIAPVPIPDKWLRRVGKYEIADPGDDAILIDYKGLQYDDGLLFLEYSMPFFFKGVMRLALAPISDDEAIIHGPGLKMGETIRAVTVDGKERLSYSGYLLKKKSEQ